MTRRLPFAHHAAQRGLSLVELMVGIAIALFIMGAAGALFVAQLRESRALLLEVRLDQELGNAADLIARQLRRAGYWGHAGAGANPYATVPDAAPADTLTLRYSLDATENDRVDANEQLGFRLRAGVLEIQLGATNWQALTDPAIVTVTALNITRGEQRLTLVPGCDQQRRELRVAIGAALVADPRVARTVSHRINVRADELVGGCLPPTSSP